jgi:Heterokaryon incompatibility protein (HET)
MGSVYSLLNPERREIRLVTLKLIPNVDTDENSGPIECELSVVSLNDNPDFLPISYAWGDPTPTSSIHLNGQTFLVASNLYAALCYLRVYLSGLAQINADCPLWIDAICINQTDSTEKSSQVPLMADIYSDREVWVWLGYSGLEKSYADEEAGDDVVADDDAWIDEAWETDADDDEEKRAFTLVDRWLKVLRAFQDKMSTSTKLKQTSLSLKSSKRKPAKEKDSTKTAAKDTKQQSDDRISPFIEIWEQNAPEVLDAIEAPFNETDWQALARVLNRPYWKRVWILQEIILASTITLVSGHSLISLDDIVSLIPIWESLRHSSFNKLLSLDQYKMIGNTPFEWLIRYSWTKRMWRNADRETDFIALLKTASKSQCSNPRDKIYGILGMAARAQIPISVDYRCPVDRVYIDTVVSYTRYTLDLKMIACSEMSRSDKVDKLNLPSWVPNFSSFWGGGWQTMRMASAAGTSPASFKFSDDYREFSSVGVVFDNMIYATEMVAPLGLPTSKKVVAPESFGLGLFVALKQDREFHPSGRSWLYTYFLTLSQGAAFYADAVDPRQEKAQSNGLQEITGFLNIILNTLSYLSEVLCKESNGLYNILYDGLLVIGQEWKLRGKVGNFLQRLLRISSITNRLTQTPESSVKAGTAQTVNTWTQATVKRMVRADKWLAYEDSPITLPTAEDLLADFLKRERPEEQETWPASFPLKLEFNSDSRFYRTLLEFAVDRQLIRTREGLIGSAPEMTRVDDHMCVLLGCPQPLIIRKVEKHYLIVGVCYVFGIMHGEVMELLEQNDVFIEEIVFR